MRIMGRKQFLIATAALLAALLAAALAHAQEPGRMYRVGALFNVSGPTMQPYREALAERLATHGFVENRNLQIDARGAYGEFHQDRAIARELVSAKADALFVSGDRAVRAAYGATTTVPIIFIWVADPVAAGVARTYAVPGRNVTGVSNRLGELLQKRLELVRELVPAASSVVVLGLATDTHYRVQSDALRKSATSMGIELLEYPPVRVVQALQSGAQAMIALFQYPEAPLTGAHVVEESMKAGVPVLFPDSSAVKAGALLSYGTNLVDEVRRGADLLARVLNGATPGKLPVDQAARFELWVNLKTARVLGLTLPHSIMLRADQAIE